MIGFFSSLVSNPKKKNKTIVSLNNQWSFRNQSLIKHDLGLIFLNVDQTDIKCYLDISIRTVYVIWYKVIVLQTYIYVFGDIWLIYRITNWNQYQIIGERELWMVLLHWVLQKILCNPMSSMIDFSIGYSRVISNFILYLKVCSLTLTLDSFRFLIKHIIP